MALHYLTFKTQEIPEGRSDIHLELYPDVLEEGDPRFLKGKATLSFFKTQFFIEVGYELTVTVQLQCDRSLDLFDHVVETSYKVVFKADASNIADERMAERSFSNYGEEIDLKSDIRDSILLSLPIQPIHPRFKDGEGNLLAFETQQFGASMNPDSEGETIDPRWNKLKELKQSQFARS